MTAALSLLAGAAAMIGVLTIATEACADAPKQGAATAQVLAQESKPMPKAAPQHAPRAQAKSVKPKKHAKHAKPAKAPVKAASKPGSTARV
jgi:hypothetical protein